MVAAPSPASPTPPAPATSSPATDQGALAQRHFEVRFEGRRASLDPEGPEPPVADACDLTRLYRGRIGDTSVSLWLQARGGRVTGEVHYDLPGPGIAIDGQRHSDTITLRERGAGTFEGRCDPATGRLAGTPASRHRAADPATFRHCHRDRG